MKPIEEKAGLGAPVSEIHPDGADLHARLARANVLRLRGDYAEAESICVSVLEVQPESAAAHTLLGDIAFAQDRPDQAAEHYDIAKSLDPFAPDIARKLEDARARQESRETNTAVEQLGLPTRKPLPWQFGIMAAGGVILFLTIVILASRSSRGDAVTTALNAPPIQATVDTLENRPKTKSPAATGVTSGTTEPTAASPAMSAGGTSDDRALWQTISAQSPAGTHLLSVLADPRAKNVTVAYMVSAGEDPRRIGAELARSTLERAGDALGITLRALRGDQLIYMADVSRARYDQTLTDAWQRANQGEDAWIGYCMSNEWPYAGAESGTNTSAAGSGTAPASASGASAGGAAGTP
jgi:tetratricopeptide (TPR) repeat protein